MAEEDLVDEQVPDLSDANQANFCNSLQLRASGAVSPVLQTKLRGARKRKCKSVKSIVNSPEKNPKLKVSKELASKAKGKSSSRKKKKTGTCTSICNLLEANHEPSSQVKCSIRSTP